MTYCPNCGTKMLQQSERNSPAWTTVYNCSHDCGTRVTVYRGDAMGGSTDSIKIDDWRPDACGCTKQHMSDACFNREWDKAFS